MKRRFFHGVAAALVLALMPAPAVSAPEPGTAPLRVCSDPNNLPFSDRQGRGFENELAEFIANRLGAPGVEYTWHPQRRGFVRNTLDEGQCDLIMGVPADYELAAPTAPYYRSSYVFVYPEDAPFEIDGFDDPDLRRLQLGVHVVGDDYSPTPGAAALGRRGIIENVTGYSIYGDYSQPHPPSRLIEAVAGGEIDVAIAWGPLAGYFASRQDESLRVVPIHPESDGGDIPFTFAIALATRPGDQDLRAALDEILVSDGPEIHALLARYGIPLLPLERAGGGPRGSGAAESIEERVR